MTQPGMFDDARADSTRATFLALVRARMFDTYADQGPVSVDQAFAVMGFYSMRLPPGFGPDIFATLFSDWRRARAFGWIKSERDGEWVRTWVIR